MGSLHQSCDTIIGILDSDIWIFLNTILRTLPNNSTIKLLVSLKDKKFLHNVIYRGDWADRMVCCCWYCCCWYGWVLLLSFLGRQNGLLLLLILLLLISLLLTWLSLSSEFLGQAGWSAVVVVVVIVSSFRVSWKSVLDLMLVGRAFAEKCSRIPVIWWSSYWMPVCSCILQVSHCEGSSTTRCLVKSG